MPLNQLQRLAAALLLLTLLSGCQQAAAGLRMVVDENSPLDRAQVEAAAGPLVARGAAVAVIVVAHGDAGGADFRQRLDGLGLLRGGAIAPGALALYVSYEPRYSELSAGANWSAKLPKEALREIRQSILNPALRDERLNAGIAETLAALDARLSEVTLGERLNTWFTRFSYGLLALAALAILAISPLGESARRLWRRSPPGRLAQQIWDSTPSGRRHLDRILHSNRLRMEDRAQFARSWFEGAAAANPPDKIAALGDRLKLLEEDRKRLEHAPPSRNLLERMEQLAFDYTQLGHEASRLCPPPKPAPKKKGKRAKASSYDGNSSFASDSSSYSSSSSYNSSSSSYDSSSDSWSSSSSDSGGPSSDGGSW